MTPFASVPRRTIEFETATTGSDVKAPPWGISRKDADWPRLPWDTGAHLRGGGDREEEKGWI